MPTQNKRSAPYQASAIEHHYQTSLNGYETGFRQPLPVTEMEQPLLADAAASPCTGEEIMGKCIQLVWKRQINLFAGLPENHSTDVCKIGDIAPSMNASSLDCIEPSNINSQTEIIHFSIRKIKKVLNVA